MTVDVLIKNAKIPVANDLVPTDIVIDRGKIAGRVSGLAIDAREIIDAGGHLVIPGCIDSHTHFNDPGFTHREDFLSGTSAAASGGVTTVIDMPDCSVPAVRSVADLEVKLDRIAGKAVVDYAMWGGITGDDVSANRLHDLQPQADYGVCAFKVYMTPSVPTYAPVTDAEMLEVFMRASETGLPVGVHAENLALCTFYSQKLQAAGRMDALAWAEARLPLAEALAIEAVIRMAEFTKTRVHIVHMSTGEGANLVGAAKRRGLDVTAETCPHYLTLTYRQAMAEHKSFAKIAPPLRTESDNSALWSALTDGRVDFVATDHAPYEVSTEKSAAGMNIWSSFPGIPGVELMLPIMISEGYHQGRISLTHLVNVLSTHPAIHYGLYPLKGSMEIGADADLVIVDLEREWTVDQARMLTRAKYSPFHGKRLRGKPVKTIVRGRLVYDESQGVVGTPGLGKFIRRQTISKLPKTLRY